MPELARIPLAYVAGPYRAPTRYQVERNIRAAEDMGYRIALLGAYPVIPHSNTRGYFEDAGPAELWLGGTLELMRRCDAAVFLPTWLASSGARAEHAEAEHLSHVGSFAIFGVGHLDSGEFAAWVRSFGR